jgi:enoyl-CoA hydratase/carnithine racemase
MEETDLGPAVITERRGHVALLTMNRPESGNAVNAEFMRGLLDALSECGRDDDVRAIVVAARGKVWCSGGDHATLSAGFGEASANDLFYAMGDHGLPPLSAQEQLFDPLGAGRWILAVREIEKPLIAAVSGAVAGGGLGFLGMHDYRVGGGSATFTPAFIRIGVGPDFAASWFLPRIMGPSAATEFFLSSSTYTAERALATGLVHRLVPDDEVLPIALEFAGRLAALPPLGVRAHIRCLRAAVDTSLRDQLILEWGHQQITFASGDARRALGAFHDRRADGAGGPVTYEGT